MTYSPASEHVLIAEAEAISKACRDAGRPELAAFPDGVAQRARDRLAQWELRQRRVPWWRKIARALRAVRL